MEAAAEQVVAMVVGVGWSVKGRLVVRAEHSRRKEQGKRSKDLPPCR
jgi:hypothetical protein